MLSAFSRRLLRVFSACVVDQKIDLAEVFHGRINRFDSCLIFADVTVHQDEVR